MNPESGLEWCFFYFFCGFVCFICGTQSWTYNLYCHGGGAIFHSSQWGMFQISNRPMGHPSNEGSAKSDVFFLPTQLDDMTWYMIWYDMIWYYIILYYIISYYIILYDMIWYDMIHDAWHEIWHMTYDIWLWYDIIYQHPTSFWHYRLCSCLQLCRWGILSFAGLISRSRDPHMVDKILHHLGIYPNRSWSG